jgi:PKD domain
MKELKKKKNAMKGICTLLLAAVLFGSCFSAITTTAIGTTKLDTHSYIPKRAPTSAPGYAVLLDENFTDGNMPPTGSWGDWERIQTSSNQTWYIDNTMPHTTPYCGTVHRDGNLNLQDEWLITPSLNFSDYSRVYLKFYWYTCYYVTTYKRYVEMNVSVSTNGGTSWTKIWSFDDVGKFFTDWKWYDTVLPKSSPINLSSYAGQNDVKIAFQYYSNTTTSGAYQEFSIDDVLVYASGAPSIISCNAGGPYEWWWPMQYNYNPNGVRFHGNVTNGTLGVHWLWDFGDGNTSIIPYYPIHLYNDIGTYNVTLTIIDNSTKPPRVAFDSTTVTLFLTSPPEIDITVPNRLSIGIRATIVNAGLYNASYVNWTMKISWGPLQIFGKTVANGTLDNIEAGSSADIRSPYYFFGFGRMHYIISAYPENLPGIIKHYNGPKIGPLVFIMPEGYIVPGTGR